jgi:ATP-binding cassette subfamily F protein uup
LVDGTLRHLPGGIEQYLAERPAAAKAPAAAAPRRASAPTAGAARRAAGAQRRAARREVARIERELDTLATRDGELQQAMARAATDAGSLRELSAELAALGAARDRLESGWLELSGRLQDG